LLDFEDSVVCVHQSFEQPDDCLLSSLEVGAVVLLCRFNDQLTKQIKLEFGVYLLSKLVFNSDCNVASFGLSESHAPQLDMPSI
jgi:hypothetical protein